MSKRLTWTIRAAPPYTDEEEVIEQKATGYVEASAHQTKPDVSTKIQKLLLDMHWNWKNIIDLEF